MVRRLVANVAPGSSGVTGNESNDGEGDGDGMLQVDCEERDVWNLVLGREMSEVGKDEERIEASTAQVSAFETDGLHAAFCAAEYVAKTMDASDFESELHRETEAFVLEASTSSACCDSPVSLPTSIPSSQVQRAMLPSKTTSSE